MQSADCRRGVSDADQSAWVHTMTVKLEPGTVKEEPEWSECGVSEAAAAEGLYAGHEVKDELVIAPEQLQVQDISFSMQSALNRSVKVSCNLEPADGAGPQWNMGHERQSKLENCFVKLERILVKNLPTCNNCLKTFGYKSSLKNHSCAGSESEDSDEEDGLARPFMPRAFIASLETEDDGPSDASPTLPFNSPDISSCGTLEPNHFLDFKWRPFPTIQVDSRRESFSYAKFGPTVSSADPYEIFVQIWDRQLLEHVAFETNKYAQRLVESMLNNNLRPCLENWQDTSPDELYVYLALLIAMAVVGKGPESEYWNTDQTIFMTPGFQAYMPLERFQVLDKCLHFRDNIDMHTLNLSRSEAKLFKIQPVLDHLNKAFQSLYNLQQNIALDESLLQWKGLDIDRFLSNKAVGIKSYEVCEPQTGYLWRFLVHVHESAAMVSDTDFQQTFVPSLVSTLLRGLENKGHTIWMDSLYNSPALARRLKSLGFDCAGTLRTNRQFVPHELTDLKAEMRPGQVTGLTSGDVDLLVWREQSSVAAISTYHTDAISQVKGVTKPALIHDYSVMIGGLDKKDQTLAAFPTKRTRVWYKTLFRRLLNVSILNCFIICKYNNSGIKHRSFRTSLVASILERHVHSLVDSSLDSRDAFSIREHHLVEYEMDLKLKGRKRRVCVVCKKRVTTYCVGCNKTACLSQCFVSIH